jgi:hypothetical protein
MDVYLASDLFWTNHHHHPDRMRHAYPSVNARRMA